MFRSPRGGGHISYLFQVGKQVQKEVTCPGTHRRHSRAAQINSASAVTFLAFPYLPRATADASLALGAAPVPGCSHYKVTFRRSVGEAWRQAWEKPKCRQVQARDLFERRVLERFWDVEIQVSWWI